MKGKKSVNVNVDKRTKRKQITNSQEEKKNKNAEINVYKLGPHGYPSDHPFNKDGFRYIVAEPDLFAPYRKEFDECEDWAGKPIPGFLYRKFSPTAVLVANHDRAPQLKVAEDRLTVTGEKGYCMIRGTHGVSFGTWYYEIDIESMPEGGATRLGWAQELANVHGPCGYDKFGYSWRSRKGTAFHSSRGHHYAERGYGQGDTVGCMISLTEDPVEGSPNKASYLGSTFKECPLVKVKNCLYFETKDNPLQVNQALHPLKGSSMSFYRNGECQGIAFTDVNSGVYYPAASFYKNCVIKFNFGPHFKYPPKDVNYNAVSDLADGHAVRQTLCDLVYFTENEGKLSLDNFYISVGLLKQ